MRTPDFTPSDSSFPIKLSSLHSCGAFGSLPAQLLRGTRRNPSMVKNLELLYPRLTALKSAFRLNSARLSPAPLVFKTVLELFSSHGSSISWYLSCMPYKAANW